MLGADSEGRIGLGVRVGYVRVGGVNGMTSFNGFMCRSIVILTCISSRKYKFIVESYYIILVGGLYFFIYEK